MKAYRPKNVTYNTDLSAGQVALMYTVPAGVSAKIVYFYGYGNTTFNIKINNSQANLNGRINLSGGSAPLEKDLTAWGMYLSAGDALYIYAVNASTNISAYMCIIEEYEI